MTAEEEANGKAVAQACQKRPCVPPLRNIILFIASPPLALSSAASRHLHEVDSPSPQSLPDNFFSLV